MPRYFILSWEGNDELHDLDVVDDLPPDGFICQADEGTLAMDARFGNVPQITVDDDLEREVVEANDRQYEGEAPSRLELFKFLMVDRLRFGLYPPHDEKRGLYPQHSAQFGVAEIEGEGEQEGDVWFQIGLVEMVGNVPTVPEEFAVVMLRNADEMEKRFPGIKERKIQAANVIATALTEYAERYILSPSWFERQMG